MTADHEITLPPSWQAWQIRGFLGEGSYGRVYKAEKISGGVSCWSAIKVITVPPEDSQLQYLTGELQNQEAVRTYLKDQAETYAKEIETMYSLQGISNIVSIQDHVVVPAENGPGWVIFIRMELLTPFPEYQVAHPLKEPDIIRFGESICRALIRCGTKGIIHRDIKPENIFVTDDGEFKLGDFGVARHLDYSASGYSVKGTYEYIAPEVYKCQPYDNRADLYSLGLILYKLANRNTGALLDPNKKLILYSEKTAAFEKRMEGEPLPPPADCSKALADVILKACAFRPEDRYRNVQEMLDALTALNTGKAGRKKKKVFAAAVLATLLVAAGALAIAGLGRKSAENRQEPASAEDSGQKTVETQKAQETQETQGTVESQETISWHMVEINGGRQWVETDRIIEGEVRHPDGSTDTSALTILVDKEDAVWLLAGMEESGEPPPDEPVFFDLTLRAGSEEETIASAAKYENNIISLEGDAAPALIGMLQSGQAFGFTLSDPSGQGSRYTYQVPVSDGFGDAYTQIKNESS